MKPGPQRSCDCGTCRRCYLRRAGAAYYTRHRESRIAANIECKRKRRERDREMRNNVADSELDRRAAEWLKENAWPTGEKTPKQSKHSTT